MLRLRKVEMFGFKSFAERTAVVFNGTGIAAVVGPNGCGKSNIADAILWVLGEQSAKTLRSTRMADCIFNGTANRLPTNLAEVTLTLVEPEGERVGEDAGDTPAPLTPVPPTPRPCSGQAPVPLIPRLDSGQAPRLGSGQAPVQQTPRLDSEQAPEPLASPSEKEEKKRRPTNRLHLKILPGEVVVTRRLYRDGTSEYYMNGDLCRLRDIQELFLGTGLGPESYAIIEQGRIGQILSSRPTDRRAILEEAAGVSKYKVKRRLAEAKLIAAQQNLARVNDILEEVSKQVNSLKRQAARARRWRELKAEAAELGRQLLANKLSTIRHAETALAEQLQIQTTTLEERATTLRELEAQQARDRDRHYELEAALRQAQNRAGELMLEVERAQTRLSDARRQEQAYAEQLAAAEHDQQALVEEMAAHLGAQRENLAAISQLDADDAAARAACDHATQKSDELHQEIRTLEEELGQLQQQHHQCSNRISAARAEAPQLEQAATGSREAMARLEQERDLTRSQQDRLSGEEQRLETDLREAQSELRRAQENLSSAQQRLEHIEIQYEAERQRVETIRQSLATALAQEQTLGELLEHRAVFAEPVQKLLLGAGDGSTAVEFRPVGVVADYAEFEPLYAPLLEDYLHDELEYVVVETYDAARTGVSLLRQAEVGGRATFLVDSFGRVPVAETREPGPLPQGQGVIAPLSDLVRMNGVLGSEAKRVLPKLGRTYLVDSAQAAEELARHHPHHFFLSTDGTCYHGRLVSGGARNGHGLHSLQRALADARRQLDGCRSQSQGAEGSLRELEARRRELERVLDAARQQLFAREKTLLQLEQQQQGVESERARSEEDALRLGAEYTYVENQQRNARERLNLLREQLREDEQLAVELERQLGETALQREQARQQSHASGRELAEHQAQGARLEERLTALHQQRQRLEEAGQRLVTEQQRRAEQAAQVAAARQQLQMDFASLEQAVLAFEQERQAEELSCRQSTDALTALRQRQGESEASLRRARGELEALRDQRHQLEIERTRLETERQNAVETAQSEFGLTAEQLCAQITERLEGEGLAQADLRHRELRQRLETIGPINMMALEEFEEAQKRHEFLSRQRHDLLASIADTQGAITEIDEVSRQQFEEAFTVINRNFAETFQTLFGGGSATLRLRPAEEGEDSSDPGIELVCQPPGKRLQNVLLLSGGEKALAALALLIAIFRYRPSPFCILDEVDAPLDEANVGRFTRLVQEMAPQTQFILVTHNKKTMEVAPMLYGVTMQGGVSQIVSVRFDELSA